MHRSPRSSFRTPRWVLARLVPVLLVGPFACTTSVPPASDAPMEPAPAADTTVQPTEPPPASQDPDASTPTEAASPDTALVPKVDGVSPSRATVGSVGPQVIVAGANFVPRSIVQLDGAPLATTFVHDRELRATIPTSKLAAVATLRISVGTSAPGGGASEEVSFQVENPQAEITSLSPLSVVAGAPATTLHVQGHRFVTGATIVVGEDALPTTIVSGEELTATLPKALLATSTTLSIRVRTPAPGGGDSDAVIFTVSNPGAGVTKVSPATAYVGADSLSVTVAGYGFVSSSVVSFNGVGLPTTFVSAKEVRATLPASSFAVPGDFAVGVTNPPPGGGPSTPVPFRVQYPQPSITNLSPNGAMFGGASVPLTIEGTGFYLASQITLDGVAVATTYVDGEHLGATVDASLLAEARGISVRVVNPAPGGGSSPAASFVVSNPGPSLSALTPSTASAGAQDTKVSITGAGFVPSTSVTLNGMATLSTYVSASQLDVTIPSTMLVAPGTIAVRVSTPSPGGGTAGPMSFTVGCDTSGVDVALSAIGTTTTLATNFAQAPLLDAFATGGACEAGGALPLMSISTAIQEPTRSWVVQNVSGSTATLAAWAVCTNGSNEDAFLTFYRRPTPPATTNERLACAFVVSEGIVGPGGYSSPESGGSQYCPGLTKANGGGLTLSACEKVVVHTQPFDIASTDYPAPANIKVKLE